LRILGFTAATVALALSSMGCTTVTTQTTVVTQAAAAGGAGAGAATGVVVRSSPVPQGELVPIDKWKITMVTAKGVARLGDVRDISDAFTYEGRIFMHATMTSPPGTQAGRQSFEVKWFNGQVAVGVQKAEDTVAKSPFYLASSTSGTAVGAGKGRVELYAGGKLLATKEFVVLESK
jgi:hypothetical protein